MKNYRPRRPASPRVPDWFREHANPEVNLALWLFLCGEEQTAARINTFVEFVADEEELWSLYGSELQREWDRAHPGERGPPIKLRLRRQRAARRAIARY